MRKILIFLSLLIFAINGFGQQVHEIKKGDTLWDISGKYYSDNFKWPIIWKYNVYINNPDLIYPKDRVVIPLIVKDGEVIKLNNDNSFKLGSSANQVRAKAAKFDIDSKKFKTIKLTDYEFVVKKLPNEQVVATQEGKYFVSDGDILRVSIEKDKFSKGQKLTFLRFVKGVEGGYLVKIAGYGTVKKVESNNAVVTVDKAYESLSKGLYVQQKNNNDTIKLTNQFIDIRTNVKGKVIYLSQSMNISGNGYRLVFNKGLKDGIKPGDILEIIRTNNDDGYYRESKIGEAQVLFSSENYATAAILSSSLEISKGDNVKLIKVAVY